MVRVAPEKADLSNIEAGKLDLNPEPINLARLIDEVIGTAGQLAEKNKNRAVIIPVLTQHYAMLQRNLLYTGVTRGKRLVVLVGQKQAIAIAVRNVSGRRRWSKLGEQLAPKTPVSVDRRRVGR